MQPTLFGSLNTGYSGLQVSQLQVQTVSNNIANADTEGYSRQRTIVKNSTPLDTVPGAVGLGVQAQTILRVHDEYVYNRLRSATNNKEFTGFSSDTLQEVSQYFPDMQDVGIGTDLTEFFNAWQDYADSPGDVNQAIAVTQKINTLSTTIQQAYDNVYAMQTTLNDQVVTVVDQVNALATKIATLNGQIAKVEAGGLENANDLRDERDNALLTLSGIVGVSVSNNGVSRSGSSDGTYSDITGQNYVIQVAGYPLVDGNTVHPLVVHSDANSGAQNFNSVYFQYQDYQEVNITSDLQGGRLGAILDLRGTDIGTDGLPQTGKIQSYLNSLNTFANGVIENVNNIYAGSAMESATSNPVNDLNGNATLSSLGLNVQAGTFDYSVYDEKGNIVATRTISINPDTDTMNTVVAKFNAAIDDNLDGNSKDDTNSYFQASFVTGTSGAFQINPTSLASGKGYTFAIKDSSSNPTNFAGSLGLNRMFDGNDASNITLASSLVDKPSNLHAYGAPVVGNNDIANKILDMQYNSVTFYNYNGTTTSSTIQKFYNDLSTTINADASSAITSNTTITAVFNAVDQENQSISKVSVDEELVNLMKYQSAYSANAKVISTIDQMINTLLGIKQ